MRQSSCGCPETIGQASASVGRLRLCFALARRLPTTLMTRPQGPPRNPGLQTAMLPGSPGYVCALSIPGMHMSAAVSRCESRFALLSRRLCALPSCCVCVCVCCVANQALRLHLPAALPLRLAARPATHQDSSRAGGHVTTKGSDPLRPPL